MNSEKNSDAGLSLRLKAWLDMYIGFEQTNMVSHHLGSHIPQPQHACIEGMLSLLRETDLI